MPPKKTKEQGKTEHQIAAETVEELFGDKQIQMVPGSFSWKSEPSGGDLKHDLTIKIPMDTAQRNEDRQVRVIQAYSRWFAPRMFGHLMQ